MGVWFINKSLVGFDPYIGFKVVQVLNSARTVDELDFAIAIVNKSYPILRGQIEIMEVIRDGKHEMVEKDNENKHFGD